MPQVSEVMTLARALADAFGLLLALWALYTGWRTVRTLRRPPVGPWLGFDLVRLARGEEEARRREQEYYTPRNIRILGDCSGFLGAPSGC